jgi:hypothetical protein
VLENWRVLGGKASVHHGADPSLAPLASVIVQEEVPAVYSGRVATRPDGSFDLEGRGGPGDEFMVGEAVAQSLPSEVVEAVCETYRHAELSFGPVSFEWVFDRHAVWVVQLNLQRHRRREILPADVEWAEFRYGKGRLEEFRHEVLARRGTRKGLVVLGNVSPLSHLGEIAEQYDVPVRFVSDPAEA